MDSKRLRFCDAAPCLLFRYNGRVVDESLYFMTTVPIFLGYFGASMSRIFFDFDVWKCYLNTVSQ